MCGSLVPLGKPPTMSQASRIHSGHRSPRKSKRLISPHLNDAEPPSRPKPREVERNAVGIADELLAQVAGAMHIMTADQAVGNHLRHQAREFFRHMLMAMVIVHPHEPE